MKARFIIALFILIAGCEQNKSANEEQKSVQDTSADKDTSLINNISSAVKNINDSTQQNHLKPGSDTLFFKLSINSINQHLVIPVLISSGKELFAVLFSNDKKANIRINQIELPDSAFDGPFGKKPSIQNKNTWQL